MGVRLCVCLSVGVFAVVVVPRMCAPTVQQQQLRNAPQRRAACSESVTARKHTCCFCHYRCVAGLGSAGLAGAPIHERAPSPLAL
jgi:hypothetical protein